MISLVIPTYNEAPVVELTLRRATEVLKAAGESFELIVVDDSSPDGTADIVERLSAELPVRVIRREGERGLATAVVHGWRNARGDVVGVMDADLQHPPEVVCQLIQALRAEDADIAMASRYLPGGGSEGWTWFRRIVSWAGMRVGAVALPWTLGLVSDSGSGLFLMRAKAIEGLDLRPRGIKMLLEVLAKARYRKIVQIPYVFRGRTLGVSKTGPRQFFEFLASLYHMSRDSGELAAWYFYALGGVLGAAAYIAALYGFNQQTDWPFYLILPLALVTGLLVSFAADEVVTFRGERAGAPSSLGSRFAKYQGLLLPSALVNGTVTFAGKSLGLEIWTAAVFGLAAALLWNFVFAIPSVWAIWRRPRGDATGGP